MSNQEKQRKNFPKNLERESEIRNFFQDVDNERYFYVTYEEFLKIFEGIDIDYNYIPKINKLIIYGHLNYFNNSYDSLWSYKWYPVYLKFVYNTRNIQNFFLFFHFKKILRASPEGKPRPFWSIATNFFLTPL